MILEVVLLHEFNVVSELVVMCHASSIMMVMGSTWMQSSLLVHTFNKACAKVFDGMQILGHFCNCLGGTSKCDSTLKHSGEQAIVQI